MEDAAAPAAARIGEVFQQALHRSPGNVSGFDTVTVLDSALWGRADSAGAPSDADLCVPLTFHLPAGLTWADQALYAACQDVAARRQQVSQWGYSTGDGTLVLPIVLTAKGPLYAEVIGPAPQDSRLLTQPIHFSDTIRQPLYALGQRLLRSLDASAAVYLLQFSVEDEAVCFDRLFPFPDERAIASINIQTPDLFTCHWLCKTHQPIHDLLV